MAEPHQAKETPCSDPGTKLGPLAVEAAQGSFRPMSEGSNNNGLTEPFHAVGAGSVSKASRPHEDKFLVLNKILI